MLQAVKSEDNSMKMQQVDFSSLYFGTPVAILSSQNPDGSTNLSPISSWWILEKHIFPANKRVSCSNRGPCCCTPVAGKK